MFGIGQAWLVSTSDWGRTDSDTLMLAKRADLFGCEWSSTDSPVLSTTTIMGASSDHNAKEYSKLLEKFTVPALQKHFVNIFFVFAWEFSIEERRGFLVNFFWAPFPGKQSTKTPPKIRGKFGAKFGAKFGTKIRKIRGTFVLQLF